MLCNNNSIKWLFSFESSLQSIILLINTQNSSLIVANANRIFHIQLFRSADVIGRRNCFGLSPAVLSLCLPIVIYIFIIIFLSENFADTDMHTKKDRPANVSIWLSRSSVCKV